MQRLVITVPKVALYDRLEALTHYQAQKATSDSGAFDRVALVPSNQDILTQWMPDITQQLNSVMAFFISGAPVSADMAYSVTLSMPESWDASLASACNESAMKYCVSRLAEQWMLRVNPENAEDFKKNAEEALAELISHVHHRKRPGLPTDFLPESPDSDSPSGDTPTDDTPGETEDYSSTTDHGPGIRPGFDFDDE